MGQRFWRLTSLRSGLLTTPLADSQAIGPADHPHYLPCLGFTLAAFFYIIRKVPGGCSSVPMSCMNHADLCTDHLIHCKHLSDYCKDRLDRFNNIREVCKDLLHLCKAHPIDCNIVPKHCQDHADRCTGHHKPFTLLCSSTVLGGNDLTLANA